MRITDVRVGDAAPELRVVMEREGYLAYNALVKNINPLHSDKAYARGLGFEDIVVAGVYTYSFLTKVVEDWVGESGRIAAVEVWYERPILIEATLVHDARVSRKSDAERWLEVEVRARDDEGTVYTRALVTVVFA